MPVFADAAGVLRLGAPPGGGGPAQPGGAAAGAGEARGIRPAPDVSWCWAFNWRAVFCALHSRCLSLTGRKRRWGSTAPFVFGLAADSVDVRFYTSSPARVVQFSRAARKTAAGKYHVQYTGVLLCPRVRASYPIPLLRDNTKCVPPTKCSAGSCSCLVLAGVLWRRGSGSTDRSTPSSRPS